MLQFTNFKSSILIYIRLPAITTALQKEPFHSGPAFLPVLSTAGTPSRHFHSAVRYWDWEQLSKDKVLELPALSRLREQVKEQDNLVWVRSKVLILLHLGVNKRVVVITL